MKQMSAFKIYAERWKTLKDTAKRWWYWRMLVFYREIALI